MIFRELCIKKNDSTTKYSYWGGNSYILSDRVYIIFPGMLVYRNLKTCQAGSTNTRKTTSD